MKSYLSISLLAIIAFCFVACDKIDNPVLPPPDGYRSDLYGEAPAFNPITSPVQNVLLEDFTGHDCGNCPTAHQIAYGILNNHPDRLSMVAIHAGTLGKPKPPNYPANWTTPAGDFFFDTQVGIDEMPRGRINRKPNASTVLSPGLWSNRTNQALADEPTVVVQIKANYHADAGHLNVHVNHQWFANHTGDYRLVILITENKIMAPQLWYGNVPEYVALYEHNHMLRGTVTGATGLRAASNPTNGLNQTMSYTMNWNSAWIPENCELIAYITEGENGRVLNSTRVNVIN